MSQDAVNDLSTGSSITSKQYIKLCTYNKSKHTTDVAINSDRDTDLKRYRE